MVGMAAACPQLTGFAQRASDRTRPQAAASPRSRRHRRRPRGHPTRSNAAPPRESEKTAQHPPRVRRSPRRAAGRAGMRSRRPKRLPPGTAPQWRSKLTSHTRLILPVHSRRNVAPCYERDSHWPDCRQVRVKRPLIRRHKIPAPFQPGAKDGTRLWCSLGEHDLVRSWGAYSC